MLLAHLFLLVFHLHYSRHAVKFNSHSSIILEKGDLLLVLTAAALAIHKLPELVQVFGFDDASLEPVMKLRLFIDENLRLVTDDDKVGLTDRFVVELLSRQKAITTNQTGDVHSGFEPTALHDRVNGVRSSTDDVAAANRFFRRGFGYDFNTGFLAHFSGKFLPILFRRTVYFNLGERTHGQMSCHLSPRLFT